MANDNLDILGFSANTITDILYFIKKLITVNNHKHTIEVIYKRSNICVKTLEHRDSSNEYPRFIKQEENVFYYKMPIGMSYKEIEAIHDVFETSLMAQVKIIELKHHPKAHFSITITEKIA